MDRRTRYTKQVIKDTFLSLLKEKDITKISVMELCKECDINRATFYRYYVDIFDLLRKLEDEFIEEVRQSYLKHDYSDYDLNDYVLDLLRACINNKEFVKILFNNKSGIIFLHEVLEDAYQICKLKWQNIFPRVSDEIEAYTTTYIFNGTLGIVNYWVQNDFDKDIDTVASIIQDLCYSGINKVIYNN